MDQWEKYMYVKIYTFNTLKSWPDFSFSHYAHSINGGWWPGFQLRGGIPYFTAADPLRDLLRILDCIRDSSDWFSTFSLIGFIVSSCYNVKKKKLRNYLYFTTLSFSIIHTGSSHRSVTVRLWAISSLCVRFLMNDRGVIRVIDILRVNVADLLSVLVVHGEGSVLKQNRKMPSIRNISITSPCYLE